MVPSNEFLRHADEEQVELDVNRSFVYYPKGVLLYLCSLSERRVGMLTRFSSRGGNVGKEKAAVQSDHSSTKGIPHALLLPRISRYSPSSSLGIGREASLASSGTDISFPHT